MARPFRAPFRRAHRLRIALPVFAAVSLCVAPFAAGARGTPSKKQFARLLKKFERANRKNGEAQVVRLLCPNAKEQRGFLEMDDHPFEWPTGRGGWPKSWIRDFVRSAELEDATSETSEGNSLTWQLRSTDQYVRFGLVSTGKAPRYCIDGYDLSKAPKLPSSRPIEVHIRTVDRFVRLPPGAKNAATAPTREKIFADGMVVAISKLSTLGTAEDAAYDAKNTGAGRTKIEVLSDGWFVTYRARGKRGERRGVMQRGVEGDAVTCEIAAKSTQAFRTASEICRSLRAPPRPATESPGRATAMSLRPDRFTYQPTPCGTADALALTMPCSQAQLTPRGSVYYLEDETLRRMDLNGTGFGAAETVVARVVQYAADDAWVVYATEDRVQTLDRRTQRSQTLKDACREFLGIHEGQIATACRQEVRIFRDRADAWELERTLRVPRKQDDGLRAAPAKLGAMIFAGRRVVIGLPRERSAPDRAVAPGRVIAFDEDGRPSEVPAPRTWERQFKNMPARRGAVVQVAPAPFGRYLAGDEDALAVPGTTGVFVARLGASAAVEFIEVPLPYPYLAIETSLAVEGGLIAVATRSAYVQTKEEDAAEGPIEDQIFVIDTSAQKPAIVAQIPRSIAAIDASASGKENAPVLQPGARPTSSSKFGHYLLFEEGRLAIVDGGLTLGPNQLGGAIWMLDASRSALASFAATPSRPEPSGPLPFGPAVESARRGPYAWSSAVTVAAKRKRWYRELLSLAVPAIVAEGPLTVVAEIVSTSRSRARRTIALGELDSGGNWTRRSRRVRTPRPPKSRRSYVDPGRGIIGPRGRRYSIATLQSYNRRSRGHVASRTYFADCPAGLEGRVSLTRLRADCALIEVDFTTMESPVLFEDRLTFLSERADRRILVSVRIHPAVRIESTREMQGVSPFLVSNPLSGRTLAARMRRGEFVVQPVELERPEKIYPWLKAAPFGEPRLAVRTDGRPLAAVTAVSKNKLAFFSLAPQGDLREIEMPGAGACGARDLHFHRWKRAFRLDAAPVNSRGWDALSTGGQSADTWCVASPSTLEWRSGPAPARNESAAFDAVGRAYTLAAEPSNGVLEVAVLNKGTKQPIGQLSLPGDERLESAALTVSAAGERVVVTASTEGANGDRRWWMWLAESPDAEESISSLDIKVD